MIFHVNVIGCNAEQFSENYCEYIIEAKESEYCEDWNFTLDAPAEIHNEIHGLQEEGIYIEEDDYIAQF